MAEAFIESNLALMATCIVGTTAQRVNWWTFKANETKANIQAAAYFADMVPRGLLGEDDLIYVIASDGAYLGRISDAGDAALIALDDIDVTE